LRRRYLEHVDGVIGGDGRVHLDGEGLLDELVGDVEQLEGLEVGGLVELEVDGPDVVAMGRPQHGAVSDRRAHPGALLGLLQHPKSLVTAESLSALVVHAVALPTQNARHPSIPVAGVGPGQ
jgi:hypothetical protein